MQANSVGGGGKSVGKQCQRCRQAGSDQTTPRPVLCLWLLKLGNPRLALQVPVHPLQGRCLATRKQHLLRLPRELARKGGAARRGQPSGVLRWEDSPWPPRSAQHTAHCPATRVLDVMQRMTAIVT